jgi:hypothetical protein
MGNEQSSTCGERYDETDHGKSFFNILLGVDAAWVTELKYLGGALSDQHAAGGAALQVRKILAAVPG